jgi:uncharacterized protein (TIGR00725 family)
MQPLRMISVIGAGNASERAYADAERVGGLLAQKGYGVVTGGKAGVMEAASKGCSQAGGFVLGILPENSQETANRFCNVVVPTGMGQGRNLLVILSGLGAIAVSGSAGTLSEIGYALKHGKPVVSLGSWDLPGVTQAKTPEEAVAKLLDRLGDSA